MTFWTTNKVIKVTMTSKKPDQYKAQEVIEAIQGSGGIVSTIAKRLGTNWLTVRRYIDNYPTIKAAFDAERESLLDIAESVLANNIKLALKQQQEGGGLADSTDAKWALSRLGKHRGFSDKQEVELSGSDITIKVEYADSNGSSKEPTS